MSFWIVPPSADSATPWLPRHGRVQRQQDDGRRVDGHRRRHAVERDAVEQLRHVLDRVDGHADAADLAGGQRVVGVVAHLRRQVEGDAQAVDPLRRADIDTAGWTRRPSPNPAYCRIVHSRPRYIVGWMPRVKGNAPGSPRAVVRRPVRQVVRRIECPIGAHGRIVQATDRTRTNDGRARRASDWRRYAQRAGAHVRAGPHRSS